MDFEKAYNEMVQRARELHEVGNALTKMQMEIVCPELAESEDERMINELQGFLDSFGADYFGTGEWQKFHAWLEKQKVNTEGDFGRGYDCGYQAGYAVAMNEMKPKVATATLDSEKQKESLHVPESCKENADSFTDEDERIRKWLIKTIHLIGVDKDICADQETMDKAIAWLEKQKELPFVTDVMLGYPGLYFYDGERMHFRGSPVIEEEQKEQNPVEFGLWKDTKKELPKPDSLILVQDFDVIRSLYYEGDGYLDKADNIKLSIYQKWCYQSDVKKIKPVEWSEEDEKMVANLRSTLANISVRGLIKKETEQKYSAWLKSLRPIVNANSEKVNVNWSEEDEKRYVSIRTALEVSAILEKGEYDANVDWLRKFVNSVKYRKSLSQWKPSEEQMSGLAHAINLDVYDAKRYGLDSLYNDLKKL